MAKYLKKRKKSNAPKVILAVIAVLLILVLAVVAFLNEKLDLIQFDNEIDKDVYNETGAATEPGEDSEFIDMEGLETVETAPPAATLPPVAMGRARVATTARSSPTARTRMSPSARMVVLSPTKARVVRSNTWVFTAPVAAAEPPALMATPRVTRTASTSWLASTSTFPPATI